MTSPVTYRPRARLDLAEQFVYLGEEAGIEVAERYFAAVDETCALLVKHPRSGALYNSATERLAGMRRVRVKGFDNYLLFYVRRAGAIDVVRVLHAARDAERIFVTEES